MSIGSVLLKDLMLALKESGPKPWAGFTAPGTQVIFNTTPPQHPQLGFRDGKGTSLGPAIPLYILVHFKTNVIYQINGSIVTSRVQAL